MTTLPTTTELISLGADIANDGFEPHETSIADVVAVARRYAPDLTVVEALADRTTPAAVRARALSAVTARWADIVARSEAGRRQERFAVSFDELLQASDAHHRLKRAAGSIAELSASRARLDALRRNVTRSRRALTGATAS